MRKAPWLVGTCSTYSHRTSWPARPAPLQVGAGDEEALLALATEILTTPLPADQPLWSATLVTDLDDSGCALVVIFHHVLADGVGGLAVLANLVDGAPPSSAYESDGKFPAGWELAHDAAASRLDRCATDASRSYRCLTAAGRC